MILNPRKYKDFNELFAQYLGCTKDEEDNWKFSDGSKMTKTMHFHDRWDWLMMIAEKIISESNNELSLFNVYSTSVSFGVKLNDQLKSFEEKTLLLNVYNVCYQYIKDKNNE